MTWQYRVTATGVFLTGFSVATAMAQVPTAVNALAAVAGGVVAFFDVRGQHGRVKAVVFQPRQGDRYADIAQSEVDRGRIIRTAGDVGLMLIPESRRLRRGCLEAYVDEKEFVLPHELTRWALPFLSRQIRRSTVHNGRVVGLASDLPSGRGGDESVRLKRVNYFDFVCSNILAGYDVRELGFGGRMYGRRLFVDRNGHLRSFADSWLANTIGVSTLAITRDGKLLLPFHTRQNTGSPELYPPSGSGSLEPQDLPPSGRSFLRDIVIHGALRELREECGVRASEMQATEVLGHARWLTRGAVPEFAAVTLVSVTSEEVESRKISHAERPYIHLVGSTWFTPIEQWDPAEPLSMVPADVGVKASWPLAFALSCLAEAMTDDTFRLCEEIRRRLTP